MAWLPNGEKILKMCLFVLTECMNVTDTHTDRHRVTAEAALAWHHAAKLSALTCCWIHRELTATS